MKKASLRFAAHPLNSSHLFLTNSYLSKNEKKTQQRDQTGEDLLQLLLSNVCALLDQLAALLGTSAGSPAPAAVAATLILYGWQTWTGFFAMGQRSISRRPP